MHRTDYDFDVISGPSSREPAPPALPPAPPRPASAGAAAPVAPRRADEEGRGEEA
jgi:hypothetical protein